MFDWLFKPACPCDPAAKSWVEERLEWLAAEFGDSAFNGRPVVLPAHEFFPDTYDGSRHAVFDMFERVCGYMDVVRQLVTLRITANSPKVWLENAAGHALPDAAGTFEEGRRQFVVSLDESGFDDPMGLVGTMAHELAHVRLLGEGRVSPYVFDNELLTDLTVVHFGLGIFLANTPRNWASGNTRWPDSPDLVKPEYMTPPMFGWALAHLAWFRDEARPDWARHLTGGARAEFRQGLRYLTATADSWHRPERLRKRPPGRPG
jgi:hypothetical protein